MPETRLTTEEVRHLAALARIGMTDEELETMRDQMSNILENFDILSEVDTESVEPTGHSVEVTSVMRDDIAAESSPTEETLANVPAREGDFVRVRVVLE